jgi:hypothetical protein
MRVARGFPSQQPIRWCMAEVGLNSAWVGLGAGGISAALGGAGRGRGKAKRGEARRGQARPGGGWVTNQSLVVDCRCEPPAPDARRRGATPRERSSRVTIH